MDKVRRKVLDADLARLNAEVEAVLAKRRHWMDAHMADYARFQVGETLYDMQTGALLGVVSRLYRYWDGRDPRYDTSMSIEYEFETPRKGCFDNTSRYAGLLRVGNAEDRRRHLEVELRIARRTRPDGGVDWDAAFAASATEKEPTP